MATEVPFVDLSRVHEPLAGRFGEALTGLLERGDFILGGALADFEQAFSRFTGSAACVGIGSGTAALQLATEALGIGPGDEVIVPAHTYIASALGPLHAGATPIFCDVDESSGLIDLDSAAQAVGPRTAAVLAVDLYGQACDGDALAAFAGAHGLALIEDAAQAHGASWRGRPCGSLGSVTAFSFYPSKNLGALGDGGAITTSDEEVAERARALRHLGQRRKGVHELAGYNERLDTFQAAILAIKLERLEAENASRRAIAERYRERLPAAARALPRRESSVDVHHLFPVRLRDRSAAAAALAERGIDSGLHYSPAVHQQPPFAGTERRVPLPHAEAWAEQELSLPIFAWMREQEADRVCEALAEHLDSAAGEAAE
jgi:dTDP-3-amino-3,4,6-trideoxy-alpha-D-glucose transaminase